MQTISIIDTSITSYNLGNQIIMESVNDVLNELFPEDFFFNLPWDEPISKIALKYMCLSDYVFFGGTNSLSSHILRYKQFGFRAKDLMKFNDLTLLGMGWWQYQGRPDPYTKIFLKRLLSNKNLHSVRDNYTKNKLASIGINNSVNTCCPTTWGLTADHCALIPSKRSENVLLTFTDYKISRDLDEKLLSLVSDSYKKIYYWVQGIDDEKYINSFNKFKNRITVIPPKVNMYNNVLKNTDCDYIGTRLHAGIRALQNYKRSLIIKVDNRASEISNDINLNACDRDDFQKIEKFISNEYITNLNLPLSEIDKWKKQFK